MLGSSGMLGMVQSLEQGGGGERGIKGGGHSGGGCTVGGGISLRGGHRNNRWGQGLKYSYSVSFSNFWSTE